MWVFTIVPPAAVLAVDYMDGMNHRAGENRHAAWQSVWDARRLDTYYRNAFLPQALQEAFAKSASWDDIQALMEAYPDRSILQELIRRELDWNDLANLYHDKIEKPIEKPAEVASEKENFQPLAKDASRQELAGLAGLVARQIQDGQSQE